MMRRVLAVLIVPVLVLLVLAGPATAQMQIRATATSFQGSPWWEHWNDLKAVLDPHPDFEVDYFLQSELGNEEQQIAALRRGRVEIGAFSCLGLASSVPELAVLLAPYLFASEEEVDHVYDTALFDPVAGLLEGAGMRLMAFNEAGFAQVFANRPVTVPAEAQGLKMRGSPNPASQVFLENIGADRVALGTADVVPSLQTGLIEGGVSGIVFYSFVAQQFAPHLTLTDHSYECSTVVVNDRWFQRLSADQQAVVESAFTPLAQSRQMVRPWIDQVLEDARAEGVTVHVPEGERLAAWKAAQAGAPDRIAADVGPRAEALLATVREAQARFRAGEGAGAD